MSKTKNYTVVISSGELRGLTLLLLLLIVIIVFPLILKVSSNAERHSVEFLNAHQSVNIQSNNLEISPDHIPKNIKPINVNVAEVAELISIGIPERTARTMINFRNKGMKFRTNEDMKKIYGMNDDILTKIQPFVVFEAEEKQTNKPSIHNNSPQDLPIVSIELIENEMAHSNTLIETKARAKVLATSTKKEDWVSAGLSEKLASTICKYLSKGGVFEKADDLLKIYGLDSAEWKSLTPFLVFQKDSIQENVDLIEEKVEVSIALNSIGINTATRDEWLNLPGINHGIVTRIFNYRSRLGGFYSLNQIKEVYGLSETLVENIEPYLVLDSMTPELMINEISREDLSKHPYVSPKEAKLIIAYRNQHGRFRSKTDLQKMFGLEKNTIERISAYIVY